MRCLMYRVTSRQDVQRSLDFGRSWQPVFHHPDAAFAARDLQISAPTILVMAESGNGDAVVRSLDEGHSWDLADGGIEGQRIESVTTAPGHPAVMYAVVDQVGPVANGVPGVPADPVGLYVTDSGGARWNAALLPRPVNSSQPQTDDPPSQIQVDPEDPAHLWAMVDVECAENVAPPSLTARTGRFCAEIFESTNSGTTWTSINPELPVNAQLVGNQFLVTRSATHGLRLYLNTSLDRSQLPPAPPLVSADDGAHWSPLPVPPLMVSSLAADPADPDIMVFAGSIWTDSGSGASGNDALVYFATRNGWDDAQSGPALLRGQSAFPVTPLRDPAGTYQPAS
jgi:hypothetical protein